MDPNEPPFPVRPNEPLCQYYMKNGTCKFGQSCKFHHPSQILSSTMLTRICTVCPMSNELFSVECSQKAFLQFLPQRPSEPNCTFYMRNGTCKYGATCKFHHPTDTLNAEHPSEQLSRPRRGRSASAGAMSEVSKMPVMFCATYQNVNEDSFFPHNSPKSQFQLELQNESMDVKHLEGEPAFIPSRTDSPSLTSTSISSSYGTTSFASEQESLSSFNTNNTNTQISTLQAGNESPWSTSSNSSNDNIQTVRAEAFGSQTNSISIYSPHYTQEPSQYTSSDVNSHNEYIEESEKLTLNKNQFRSEFQEGQSRYAHAEKGNAYEHGRQYYPSNCKREEPVSEVGHWSLKKPEHSNHPCVPKTVYSNNNLPPDNGQQKLDDQLSMMTSSLLSMLDIQEHDKDHSRRKTPESGYFSSLDERPSQTFFESRSSIEPVQENSRRDGSLPNGGIFHFEKDFDTNPKCFRQSSSSLFSNMYHSGTSTTSNLY